MARGFGSGFFQVTYASQMPTPGAMAYGFESEMMARRPLVGPAIGARFQFTTLFPAPQAYQAASLAWQSGLTGVVHGQIALQPLSNPYGA